MEKYYIGVENLMYRTGHPFCEDKTNQMNLIYQGYGAFKQEVTSDIIKTVMSKELVLGYHSISGYEINKPDTDNFTPVECSSVDEARALVDRVVNPWYSDRHHPILLFVGEIYAFIRDELGNQKKVSTLREWHI